MNFEPTRISVTGRISTIEYYRYFAEDVTKDSVKSFVVEDEETLKKYLVFVDIDLAVAVRLPMMAGFRVGGRVEVSGIEIPGNTPANMAGVIRCLSAKVLNS